MRKLKNAAHIYMVLGLVSGIFYREFTKFNDFHGKTQMSIVHTHILALGMLFFMVVLALEKQFQLSKEKLFPFFFWFYNVGLVLTIGGMEIHGISTVVSHDVEVPPYLPGTAHVLLMLGLILLFVVLGKRLDADSVKPSSN